MLRPEFLKVLKAETSIAPLSPDALTGWGLENKVVHNTNIGLATAFLFQTQIPLLAKYLDLQFESGGYLSSEELSSAFHFYGVNLRHILSVAECCDNEMMAENIGKEVLLRTLKHVLRLEMRKAVLQSKPLYQSVKYALNFFLDLAFQDVDQWTTYMENQISSRFGRKIWNVFEPRRLQQIYSAEVFLIVEKLTQRCGIRLTAVALKLFRNPESISLQFRFNEAHFSGFEPIVRKVPFLDLIQAKSLIVQAEELRHKHIDCQTARLLNAAALEPLQSALSQQPDNPEISNLFHIQRFLSQWSQAGQDKLENLAKNALQKANGDEFQCRLIVDHLVHTLCELSTLKTFVHGELPSQIARWRTERDWKICLLYQRILTSRDKEQIMDSFGKVIQALIKSFFKTLDFADVAKRKVIFQILCWAPEIIRLEENNPIFEEELSRGDAFFEGLLAREENNPLSLAWLSYQVERSFNQSEEKAALFSFQLCRSFSALDAESLRLFTEGLFLPNSDGFENKWAGFFGNLIPQRFRNNVTDASKFADPLVVASYVFCFLLQSSSKRFGFDSFEVIPNSLNLQRNSEIFEFM
jgi:hypothetical protein